MSSIQAYKIQGSDLTILEILLAPQGTVRADPGAMVYKDACIDMSTGIKGGLWAGMKRKISGETFFVPDFMNTSMQNAIIAFAAPYPGKILPIDLSQHAGVVYGERHAYLCSDTSIDISAGIQKRIEAGLFGGEGFVLQKYSGPGLVFIHAGGNIIHKKLRHGDSVDIDTGCVVAFSGSVTYDVYMVPGIRNMVFGGEGLWMSRLTGPGDVYIQSMPFSRLAAMVISQIPQPKA